MVYMKHRINSLWFKQPQRTHTIQYNCYYGTIFFAFKCSFFAQGVDNWVCYKDVYRTLLSSAQVSCVIAEEFDGRVQSDLLQFIDVEDQLTAMYGKPDCRFFLTNNEQNKTTRYMFQSGTWDMEQMLHIYEKELVVAHYSIWGNVVLRTWIDAKNEKVEGKYLTRIMLYYHPNMEITTNLIAAPIIQFPAF